MQQNNVSMMCMCIILEKKKKKCNKNGIDYKILESDSTSPTTFHVAYTHSIAYDHMIIESISHMLHSLKNTVVAYSNIACLWPSQCAIAFGEMGEILAPSCGECA